MGVKDVKRVINDTLLYATNPEGSFRQVVEYLTLVGNNGIELNSNKFSFGEDTVDWAGTKHVKAIREFPTPINLTDMCSYCALVNQVPPYYCVQTHLQPFRELLKKKAPWYWDGLLQRLFEESREHIIMEVLKGKELFDKTKWTAVCTDWSKMGV
jgi:hypothetical protein